MIMVKIDLEEKCVSCHFDSAYFSSQSVAIEDLYGKMLHHLVGID